jgi:hypothetical protein
MAVRDSAGVRITELLGNVWSEGEEWTLSQTPLVEIGVEEGDSVYEMYEVGGARRLSDGRIVVANGGTGELRFYDREGRFIESIGGVGKGPGEFEYLVWVQVLPGDTLLAFDDMHRLTAFAPNGDVMWTRSFMNVGSSWFEGLSRPGDVRLHDGTMLMVWNSRNIGERIRSGALRPGETVRDAAVVIHYDTAGTIIDTVAVLAGVESAIHERNGRPAVIFAPMGRVVAYALGGDRIYVGSQQTFEIREYLPDGTLAGLIRRPAVDLTITDADMDRFVAAITRGVDDASARRDIEELIAALPLPPSRAAYGRLVLDATGRLWISEPLIVTQMPVRWSVFDPAVGLLGEVVVPEHFEVYEIGVDYVLGLWTDDLGVEYVRMYGLNREND